MNITPIRNEADYKQALQAIEPLFDREDELTVEELDYFDVMISLIENYESKHYQIELPDPIEAIKFRMEQQGLEVKDLDDIIGKPYSKKRTNMTIGKYPTYNLQEARRIRDEYNVLLDRNIDPQEQAKHRYEQEIQRRENTFSLVAEQWKYSKNNIKPDTLEKYWRIIELYLLPELGALPISDITPKIVKQVLDTHPRRKDTSPLLKYNQSPCSVISVKYPLESIPCAIPEIACFSVITFTCSPKNSSPSNQSC